MFFLNLGIDCFLIYRKMGKWDEVIAVPRNEHQAGRVEFGTSMRIYALDVTFSNEKIAKLI